MDGQHVRRNVLDHPGQHLGAEPGRTTPHSRQPSLLLAVQRAQLNDAIRIVTTADHNMQPYNTAFVLNNAAVTTASSSSPLPTFSSSSFFLFFLLLLFLLLFLLLHLFFFFLVTLKLLLLLLLQITCSWYFTLISFLYFIADKSAFKLCYMHCIHYKYIRLFCLIYIYIRPKHK